MTNTMKKKWKIGELAAETGLTVRTLHYYDELGLLKPTFETEGGHRLYNRTDLERLQKILTLKQLSFPLEKIKEAMDNPGFSMKEAAAKLRIDVEKKRIELEEIESRLLEVEKSQGQKEISEESLIQLLARMALLDQYLSKEQVAEIKNYNMQFGPEKLDELRADWITITEELQQAIENHASPSDWRTKSICMQWFGLASAFMGGSLDAVYDLKKIVDIEPTVALRLGIPGVDVKKLFQFVMYVLSESSQYPIPRALAYAQVAVADLAKAKNFYNRILSHLEMKPIFHRPSEVVFGKTNPEFFIGTKTHDNKSIRIGNGNTVGFWTNSKEEVDVIHQEAIAAGGSSLRSPSFEGKHLYTCYIRDLDGNVLEIMKWFDDPDKPTG